MKRHYDALPPETLKWFKVGTRMLSLTRSWVITKIDPENDIFWAQDETEWGEEHHFQVYELFWFTPIQDRFHRETVA